MNYEFDSGSFYVRYREVAMSAVGYLMPKDEAKLERLK
jgi:hypothetical protein